MSRYNWLKDLKAGDKVIVSSRWHRTIQTVDKVTPTGRINIGATVYDNTGRERGSQSWSYGKLEQATPEAIEKIRRDKIIKEALNTAREVKTLTYEQAVAILNILTAADHPNRAEQEADNE